MDQDLLAKQYKTNTPIFEKSYADGGIQEAAVDKRKIVSLVDKKFVLRNDFWVLTYLRPLRESSEIVLLEQRSAFGDHVVYKLDGGEQVFKELPEDLNLETVFGEYQPDLIFNGRFKTLSCQRGQDLVKETWMTFEGIEALQPEERDDLYYHQELLKMGETDRIWRIMASKQDNPIRALDLELERFVITPPERVILQEYYEGFISTFNSVYIVSVAILSKTFTIEKKESSKFSPTSMFSTLIALIPLVGKRISEEFDKLLKNVNDNEFKNNAEFMAKFAVDVVDLSDRVGQIARAKLQDKEKREKIFKAREPEPSDQITEIQKLVTTIIEQLKILAAEITQIKNLFLKEINKTPAFRMGQKDANEVMQEWFDLYRRQGGPDVGTEELRKKFVDSKTKKGDTAGLMDEKHRCLSYCQIF